MDAYYRHSFYHFQPDLNFFNPEVREEVYRIISFWLDLGVDGFPVDAVPFLIDPKGLDGTHIDDPHACLRELRRFIQRRNEEAIFLAEVSDDPDRGLLYFGEDDEMHMVTNFPLNQYAFLAMVREEGGALTYHFEDLAPILPPSGQWASFLRNHDELNLDHLTPEDLALLFDVLAPEKKMRLYGRGVRRRIAPMLNGDRRRIELAHSLLLAMPGTPILYYGDEIGMAENLNLRGRWSVRTPMQWSSTRNGGFSSAQPAEITRALITDHPYNYRILNVADQRRDPDSLLNQIKRLLHVRRDCPELGAGEWHVIDVGDPAVFAICHQREAGVVVALHNLSHEACTATLDLDEHNERRLVDLVGDRQYPPSPQGEHHIPLAPYGYRWLRAVPS